MLLAATSLASGAKAQEDESEGIVVYNAQHQSLGQEWVDAFTKETGIPMTKIVEAAKLLSGGGAKERPKTTFLFEKGNYWSNNYLNTASMASLALLCGSGNRRASRSMR